jgi:geranylgeranyl diphosphate synthase type I
MDPAPPVDAFRRQVDEQISRALAAMREDSLASGAGAMAMVDELARVLGAGGKRIRPTFCYWGFRAGGGVPGPEIARVAAAIELLHTFALIHDDVIDRSRMRRGVPTAYRALAEAHAGDEAQTASVEHFGRSAAILTGDLAQALADRLLVDSGFPPHLILVAFARFNRMRIEAVTGEFLDLLAVNRPGATEPASSDEDAVRRVAALKSGSYTVVGPLLVGAALAEAPAEVESVLERYGSSLGEAFQLRDDLLGTFGDPRRTGKDRDTDIREGKRTVLVVKAWRRSAADGQRLLGERLGRDDLSADEVEDVRVVIRNSGAVAETVALIDELASTAKRGLESSRALLPQEVVEALTRLADLVAVRDA